MVTLRSSGRAGFLSFQFSSLLFFALTAFLGGFWFGSLASAETLTLNSIPSGAAVLVNGRPQGRTPLRLDLQAGRYHVEIRAPKMLTWTSYLILPTHADLAVKVSLESPGGGRSLADAYRGKKAEPAEREKPSSGSDTESSGASGDSGSEEIGSTKATGLLQAFSTPLGAIVTFDGKKLGETPLLVNLPVGSHTISFAHEGYFPEDRTVTINSTKSSRVEVKMRPNGRPIPREQDGSEGSANEAGGDVQLTVLSKPQARVFLNNRDIGQTPLLTAGIAPGTYTLRLEEKGFLTHTRKIVLREGQALKLDILLVPRSK